MRKPVLLVLMILIFSCSSEDEQKEELCCGHSIEEIKSNIQANYDRVMENADQMSDRQRQILIDQFNWQLDNPCEQFKKELESAGATCDGPH